MQDSAKQSPDPEQTTAVNDADRTPGDGYSIKGLMLTALLVLPLAFFLWFSSRGLVVTPTGWALEALLRWLLPDSIHDVVRTAFQLNVEFLINPPPGMEGRGQAIAAVPLNPLIYGYGLALAGGLVFCVPNSGFGRVLQLLMLFVVVSLVQIWGCFWELLKDLSFRQVLGPDGLAMIDQIGLSQNVIGFAYQFGYLALPAVAPIVAWIIMNRRFIEGLVQPGVFGPRS